MYYALSLAGWETYQPHYFECDCSAEEFQNAVSKSIDNVVSKLVKEECVYKIYGEDIVDAVVSDLQAQGFKLIKLDFELQLGEYHSKDEDKPYFIAGETWKKILKYNKVCQKQLDARTKRHCEKNNQRG